jgi:predicted acetyltransferase
MFGNHDRAEAETMWREIFKESPEFTAYYFERRFCPEHSFGAFDDGRLVAMALGRPTEIWVEGKAHSSLLVAGVSTLPEYRGQGLMHRLMTLLTDHAKQNRFSCCYLHPVSESLYASLGFRDGTDASIICSEKLRTHEAFNCSDTFSANDLLSVYDAVQRTHDGMQMRDETELAIVMADYATENAKTLTVFEGGHPIGYIVYGGEGTVFELLALRGSAYAFLLDEAARRSGKELKAIVPSDCGVQGKIVYSMQYLVFNDAFRLPLKNGFCRLAY